MLFNSLEYIVFFVIVICVLAFLPRRDRWIWLLFSRYYFYASSKVEYLVLILISTLVDYTGSLAISKTPKLKKKVKSPEELGLPKPADFDKWWPPKGYKPLNF